MELKLANRSIFDSLEEAPDSGLFEVGKQMYCHGSY